MSFPACNIYGALFNSRPKQRLYKERRRTGEVPWSAAVFKDDSAFGIYTCGYALDVIVQCIATPLFLHGAEFGDAADLFKLLGSQYVVTLLFVYFVMAMAIIIKNNVISMIIAVCMCTGIFSLIFSGINILIEKIGVKNFDINDYLIVNQISKLDLSASAKTVGGAFAIAAVWAVVSLIAVYGVFKRRDI